MKNLISPTNPEPALDESARPNISTGSRNELSRRSFLRYAGIGAAGSALFLSGAVDTYADLLTSAPKGVAAISATDASPEDEVGEVLLDGVMMTYFSAHPAFASSIFSFGKNLSTTFTLKLPEAPGIVLTGMAGPDGPPPGGASHSQRTSSWVKDGIILGSRPDAAAKEGSDRFSKEAGSDSVQIYGLKSPRLRFTGSSNGLQFRFSDMGQRSFNLQREVSGQTAASMIGQYITDPALLFPPRFYWLDVVGGDGHTAFDFVLPRKIVVKNGITATVTARIMDQTGFRSDVLREAFAPGNNIEITYHSAHELYSTNLMELQTIPLETNARVYIDRVFKTFVMGEEPAGV